MRKFKQALVNFVTSEEGPTPVEYAVMMGLIIVACVVSITTLGTTSNKKTFSYVATKRTKTGS